MKTEKLAKHATAVVKRQTRKVEGILPGAALKDTKDLGRRQSRWMSDSNARLRLLPESSEKSAYKKAFQRARKEGNSAAVFELLKKAHNDRDRRATYALGSWYMHGCYVKKDPRRAARLFDLARKGGIAEAAFDLGQSYEAGIGCPKSPERAVKLYMEAASRGDRDAWKEIIRCIYWGIGTSKNRMLARTLQTLF